MQHATAADLGALRIAAAVVLLGTGDLWHGPALAEALSAVPPESLSAPWGAGWTLRLLDPTVARAARALVLGGALLGLLGVWARLGFALAALGSLYLLALPSLLGAPVHHHHLVWVSALLAASPCADALTIRGRGPPAAGPAYTVPVRAMWLLIGAIFFFPGLWKLLVSGPEWIFSDNLRNQLYWKWAQSWDTVPWRVDRIPGAMQAAALGVVAFELSFWALAWGRRTRTPAVIAALGFHALTAALMDVRFSTLWPLYVVFFSWDRRTPQPAPPLRRASVGVAVALVVGAVLAGASGEMRAWPLACYPTFAQTVGETMPALLVTVDGEDVPLAAMIDPEPGSWARLWRLAGIGGPVQPAALEAFWEQARRSRPALSGYQGTARFYRAEISVLPEQRGAPPQRRVLLHPRFGSSHPQ